MFAQVQLVYAWEHFKVDRGHDIILESLGYIAKKKVSSNLAFNLFKNLMRGCQKHLKNIYFCPKSSHSFPTLPLQFCLFALNRRSVTTVGSAMTISWTHLWGQFSPYRLGSVSSCDCKSRNHWTSFLLLLYFIQYQSVSTHTRDTKDNTRTMWALFHCVPILVITAAWAHSITTGRGAIRLNWAPNYHYHLVFSNSFLNVCTLLR